MPDERDPYEVLGVSRLSPAGVVRSAYWRLARQFHPDGSAPDHARMTEINAAYEAIEHERAGGSPASPGAAGAPMEAGPPQGSLLRRMRDAKNVESAVVDFGQYAGWRIADIAKADPRYLRWLSHQASGIRYRSEIEQLLGPNLDIHSRGGSRS